MRDRREVSCEHIALREPGTQDKVEFVIVACYSSLDKKNPLARAGNSNMKTPQH